MTQLIRAGKVSKSKTDPGNQSGQKNSDSRQLPLDLACTALAVVLGLFVGWLDLHVTEVTVTILALIAAGLLLGYLRPRAAWRWAVLIAIGLPAMASIAVTIGLQTAEPVWPDVRIMLLALAFALLGSSFGALGRRAVRALTNRPG